ncbi:MAG: hypothetical protein NDI62_00355 [Burkholderiales bacterium]|nr:hypothetical protein [Burkholderiales bacterium]
MENSYFNLVILVFLITAKILLSFQVIKELKWFAKINKKTLKRSLELVINKVHPILLAVMGLNLSYIIPGTRLITIFVFMGLSILLFVGIFLTMLGVFYKWIQNN